MCLGLGRVKRTGRTEGGVLLRAYRAPRVSSPVGARLRVALLSVGRFVQNLAALIAKAFAAVPLTNHEARLCSPAAGFGTLQTHRGKEKSCFGTKCRMRSPFYWRSCCYVAPQPIRVLYFAVLKKTQVCFLHSGTY